MKAWITRYALSSGIFTVEAEPLDERWPNMVVVKQGNGGLISHYHGAGKDWHLSWESAIARAERARIAKIAALEKQIAKLSGLSWEPKP